MGPDGVALLNMLKLLLLCASLLSASLCTWMLVILCTKLWSRRRRLFWCQVFALALMDLCWSIGCIAFFSRRWPTEYANYLVFQARYVLEFTSCVLEVQIAAGFMVACYRAVRVAWWLRCFIPLSVLWGLFLVVFASVTGLDGNLLERPDLDKQVEPIIWETEDFWSCIVFSSFLAATLLYTVGILGTASASHAVRVKAILRAVCYFMNFTLTYGLLAALTPMHKYHHTPILDMVSLILLALNGATNVATYSVQNRWPQESRMPIPNRLGFVTRNMPRAEQLSFHVAFDQVEEQVIYVQADSFHLYFDLESPWPAVRPDSSGCAMEAQAISTVS